MSDAHMRAQTPEESIVERLVISAGRFAQIDFKTWKRPAIQGGHPETVTRAVAAAEEGYMRGLAFALAAIRTGHGWFNSTVPDQIFSAAVIEARRQAREQRQ